MSRAQLRGSAHHQSSATGVDVLDYYASVPSFEAASFRSFFQKNDPQISSARPSCLYETGIDGDLRMDFSGLRPTGPSLFFAANPAPRPSTRELVSAAPSRRLL